MMIPWTRVLFVLALVAIFSVHIILGQSYGTLCTSKEPRCDTESNLTCTASGYCNCAYTWQVYDEEAKRCLSPLGGFCKSGDSLFCLKNAACSSKNDQLGFCLCNKPYVAVAGRSCKDRGASGRGRSLTANATPLICCLPAVDRSKLPGMSRPVAAV